MPRACQGRHTSGVGLLSSESISIAAAGFADGVEYEETFPEPPTEVADPQRPRLAVVSVAPENVVRDAPEQTVHQAGPPAVEAAPPSLAVTPAEPAPAHAASRDAGYEQQLERRLREAEAMVTSTVERLRLAEEQRLAEWIRERREEEERRLTAWVEERRGSVERSLEQRTLREEELARRIEDLLVDWQARFEQRLEQRRMDDERAAAQRRQSDEDRLRAWRADLEQALAARFPARPEGPTAMDASAPLTPRDMLRRAGSVRDVGRVLRDALSDLAPTSSLALAIHHTASGEVAYRYRVAAEDEVGALLRREALDDGPESAAAHMDGWTRAHRSVRIGTRNAVIHTMQCAVRRAEATIGVITLQTEAEPLPDTLLARVSDLVSLAAPRLAELRDSGSYRGA